MRNHLLNLVLLLWKMQLESSSVEAIQYFPLNKLISFTKYVVLHFTSSLAPSNIFPVWESAQNTHTYIFYLHVTSSPAKFLSQQCQRINRTLRLRCWSTNFCKRLSNPRTIKSQYIVTCPYPSCTQPTQQRNNSFMAKKKRKEKAKKENKIQDFKRP